MAYQNKPIRHLHGAEADKMQEHIHNILLAATQTGIETIGCTGASFVTTSMGIWMSELAELDGKSTAKFMAALSVLADPSASHTRKIAAKNKRRAAVEKLMQAVDLDMSLDGKPKH